MTRRLLRKIAYRMGYDFTFRRLPQYDAGRREEKVPHDMEADFVALYRETKAFTMTSAERMYALYGAVKHVSERGIEGDFVECGVWRGGSCMLMALILKALDDTSRRIYLYDTFTGMPRPGEVDIRHRDKSEQITRWEVSRREGYNEWCFAPLEDVKRNLQATAYPQDSLVFVKGEIETTLPATVPDSIALLRLDTDWHSSTYHELCHLYPRLVPGGALIIDDYGSFEGARKAVDQYFEENRIDLFLHRIDATGRIGFKTDQDHPTPAAGGTRPRGAPPSG